jgi:hypothetical protein
VATAYDARTCGAPRACSPLLARIALLRLSVFLLCGVKAGTRASKSQNPPLLHPRRLRNSSKAAVLDGGACEDARATITAFSENAP